MLTARASLSGCHDCTCNWLNKEWRFGNWSKSLYIHSLQRLCLIWACFKGFDSLIWIFAAKLYSARLQFKGIINGTSHVYYEIKRRKLEEGSNESSILIKSRRHWNIKHRRIFQLKNCHCFSAVLLLQSFIKQTIIKKESCLTCYLSIKFLTYHKKQRIQLQVSDCFDLASQTRDRSFIK